MKKVFPFIVRIIFIMMAIQVHAQISEKSKPQSMLQNIQNDIFPQINIQAPDVKTLQNQDAFTDKHGIAMRIAVCTPASINFIETGTWLKLTGGGRICRLAISSTEAQALVLYYKDFKLPAGGKLFLYNQSKTQVVGAFTSFNNRNGGKFATEMIYGETTILEYYQPAGTVALPSIQIEEVAYVYRTAENIFAQRGFGGSDTCEVNVNCPEGDNWQDQAKGTVKILIKKNGQGVELCSGSLINNTRQDHTPYLLTADHCGITATPEDLDQWVFYHKYQGPGCENPDNDLAFNSFTMVGATKVAAAGGSGYESDFKLLRLNESVPLSYDPYYNGWSAVDEPATSGVSIHHPQGDIKKISTYNQPLRSTNWGSVPNTHWEVSWTQTQTNWGVTEGGSSGCPIFNSEGLIVGQLTGGDAGCNNVTGPDYYGKFSHSWNKIGDSQLTRLQPWLDPDNSGIEILTGLVAIDEKQDKINTIVIYPNPTSGLVFVDFGSMKGEKAEISVSDLSGRIVSTSLANLTQTHMHEIDLRNFKPGVYFVSVKSDNGVFTQKLIR